MNPLLFLVGSREVSANASVRTAVLDICLQYGINYRDFSWEDDGSVRFRASFAAVHRLQKLCRAEGIELKVGNARGLPHLCCLYRCRMGLVVGTVIAVALMILSGRFVWDVRVTGNTAMTEGEVLDELRACGFHIGSYIPDVETGALENRVLMASDRISWISVYLDGTVARVQIIEHTAPPEEEDLSRPANLVAAADGQIELIELYRGNCVVKRGQAVKAGELLVSGLYDSQVTGYRWTRAAGKILARTEHHFTVEIPLSYEQKVYGESKCQEITLHFFDFSAKIFKNGGNLPLTCDIIKEETGKGLFGLHDLPFFLTVTTALPYQMQTLTRTPEEALCMAYSELERQLGALSSSSELLRKEIVTRIEGDTLILDCTVLCIEDIAVQVEFEISE